MNTPNKYQILQNSKGDVLVIVGYQDCVPQTPRLIYDGGDTVLLYRNASSCICLRNIGASAREALQMVDEVIVVEGKDDERGRLYMAEILMVSSVQSLIC